jgi:thiol:disulfide interchange protein DsbD
MDGPLYETPPVHSYVSALEFSVIYHENKASLFQNLQWRETIPPGEKTIRIKLRYQLCTDKICLPTDSKVLPVHFIIESGPARARFLASRRDVDSPFPTSSKNQMSDLMKNGIWPFLALAALMGVVSLLTPCVFPMIPITVSYFSNQAEGKHSTVVKLALLFSLGIIVTYTGVGLLFSFLFGAGIAIQMASNPVVNLCIAFVFIVFALSLMGVFNIKLPSRLETYLDGKSRNLGGAWGVVLMGATFTLTAFTCTVQFVGTMLIAAAQGEWIWPLVGMLVFSTVFAFPFFLLAIVPSMIKKTRGKSGAWMGRSKTVLGILELMASVKFLSNADLVWQTGIISRNTAIAVWFLLLGVIVAYLTWTSFQNRSKKPTIQWGVIALFLCLMGLVGRGWNDHSLGSLIDSVLPPPSGRHLIAKGLISERESQQIHWLDSLDEALRLSAKKRKPILLEFTGYTCVNCRWMEQHILVRNDIFKQIKDTFILVRLYTDGGKDSAANLKLQIDRFQTVALPYYIILSSENTVLKEYSGITLDYNDFLSFLTLSEPHNSHPSP